MMPFINGLEVRAIKAVIRQNQPTRSNELRNLVERFFNALKHYRGIATRYDKAARNFLAGLHLVCALNDGQALAQPQIFRRFLTAILDNIEGYLRALGQRTEARPFHRRDMDEYVFASTAVWLNEAVTLGRIEPLYCSARHVALPDKYNGKIRSAKL